MYAQVFNFKSYSSGSMVGWFDLAVCGLVVTGCKAFRKDDKLWFAWPSEKGQGKDGEDVWKDVVTAAEPVMRHLQGLVRGQLRGVLSSTPPVRPTPEGVPGRSSAASKGIRGGSPRHVQEDLSRHFSKPGEGDDIAF